LEMNCGPLSEMMRGRASRWFSFAPSRMMSMSDQLLDDHTCAEVAAILNSKGLQTGTGMPFTADVVDRLIHRRKLRSRHTRLRQRGYLTLPEAAAALGISTNEVCRRSEGSLTGLLYGVNKYLYEPPVAAACNNLTEGVAV